MTPRCDNPVGNRGPCNEPLRVSTDGNGAVRARCLRCEARAAGRCWNCGKPRTNDLSRGVFCEPCGRAAFRLAQKRTESSPERKKARKDYDRKRWHQMPEVRARRIEQRRAWLEANPERVKEYKRREWLRTKAGRESLSKDTSTAGHPNHSPSHAHAQ